MLNVIAQFETTLSAGISASATSGVLVSNVTNDGDSATIPNGTYGVVIDERNSSREYAIITIAGYNFTVVARGLSYIDGITEKASNKFAHRKGASIKISTHPALRQLIDIINGTTTITNAIRSSYVPIAVNDLVNKTYVDAAIVSGGVKASDLIYGISKLSSEPADPTDPVALNSEEVSAASAADKVVRANGDGKIDDSFIELETSNPGLAFTSNKLDIKLKSASGLSKDADGVYLDTSYLIANSGTSVSLVAGENLTAGQAVYVASITSSDLGQNSTTSSTGVGINGANWMGQIFTVSGTCIAIQKVVLYLSGSASTTTVSIRAVADGLPTGADLGSKQVTFNSGPGEIEFAFDTPVPVTPSSTYAIVVRQNSSGTNSALSVYRSNGSVYASGTMVVSSNAGSTWTAEADYDLYFKIYEKDNEVGKVYKTKATTTRDHSDNFIGFVQNTVSAGGNAIVKTTGVDANQTGLTPGVTYYLADSSGAIGSSAGSVTRKIGLAISATQILIKHENA